MADGTLKVGTITTSSGSGTITIGSGVTLLSNVPAFEAYLSADQTGLSNATATKVQFDTKVYDTDSYYDNSTNYRFTPLVAGKYYIYANLYLDGTGDIENAITSIYKNGSEYRQTSLDPVNTANAINQASVINTAVIDLNGSTDYIEVFAILQSESDRSVNTNVKSSYFGAYRIGA